LTYDCIVESVDSSGIEGAQSNEVTTTIPQIHGIMCGAVRLPGVYSSAHKKFKCEVEARKRKHTIDGRAGALRWADSL
jgi:hypothetical protein